MSTKFADRRDLVFCNFEETFYSNWQSVVRRFLTSLLYYQVDPPNPGKWTKHRPFGKARLPMMASTVENSIDRLRKGNQLRHYVRDLNKYGRRNLRGSNWLNDTLSSLFGSCAQSNMSFFSWKVSYSKTVLGNLSVKLVAKLVRAHALTTNLLRKLKVFHNV